LIISDFGFEKAVASLGMHQTLVEIRISFDISLVPSQRGPDCFMYLLGIDSRPRSEGSFRSPLNRICTVCIFRTVSDKDTLNSKGSTRESVDPQELFIVEKIKELN